MEDETARAVSLALLGGGETDDASGGDEVWTRDVLAAIPELDDDSLTTIITALTAALAYRSGMPPRNVLESIGRGSPGDRDWGAIRDSIQAHLES